MSHDFFAPSSAEIWGHCSAAAAMIAAFPKPSTDESREGDLAHAWGMYELIRLTRPGYPPVKPSEPMDDEMADAVAQYVGECLALLNTYTRGDFVGIEHRMRIPRIHETLCGGTCDFALACYPTRTLHLKDFKYGHDGVPAYECRQLIAYALGLLDELQLDDQVWRVSLSICQPRYYRGHGAKSWDVPAYLLRNYANNLHDKAEESLGPNAKATSGPWCKHCPGLHACRAGRDAGASLYEVAARGLPDPLPPEAVGVQLAYTRRALAQLKALDTALTADIESRILAGQVVDGWQLESVPGRLKWVDEEAALLALPDAWKKKPLTPTQAKAAGASEAVVHALSDRPKANKLTPLTRADVARIFPPMKSI